MSASGPSIASPAADCGPPEADSPTVKGSTSLAGLIAFVAALSYPFAVYFGLSWWTTRQVGLVMLVALVPTILSKLLRADTGSRWAIIQAPAGITLILLGALVFDDRRFILAMPVAINGILLLSFGRSLRAEQTMIERYARLVDPRLPPEEVVYCRQVTMVWCLFFAINGGIAASLALWAPLGWWALFTGLISYGLMGLLFGTEFIIRRLRFRRYGSAFYDVLLSRLFPARGDSP